MAPDPDKTLLDLTKAVEELTSMLDVNNQKLDSAVAKQTDSRKKSRQGQKALLEQNVAQNKFMQQNTLRMGGMIRGMFSLVGMLGGVKENNDRLTKALAQTGELTRENYTATLRVFRGANVSMAQAVQAVETMVGEGIGRFGNEVKLLAGLTKVLGINTKGSMQSVRFNTQALGMSQEQSVALARTMITTAQKFGSSIDGLIAAVNSMKESLINTTAELGPGMAQSVQQAAIMLGGTTTEAQAMVTDFITSITAGPEAFLKAARLGVTMTPGMTGAQVAQATLQALSAAQAIAPGPGAGSQFALAALEERNVLSRKDLVLAKMLNKEVGTLTQASLEEQVANVGRFSLEQSWQNAIFRVAELGMGAAMVIAKMIQKWGHFIPLLAVISSAIGGLVVILGPILASLRFLGVGALGATGGIIKGISGGALGAPVKALTKALTKNRAVSISTSKFLHSGFGRLLGAGFIPLTAAIGTLIDIQRGVGKGKAIGGGVGSVIGAVGLPALLAFVLGAPVTIPVALGAAVVGALAGDVVGSKFGAMFDKGVEKGSTPFGPKISKMIANMTEGDEHVKAWREQQGHFMAEGEKDRKAQLRELEDMNRMMRGSLEGNAADSPLSRLADDIALQVQGLNQLVDLATAGNDTRDASLDTLRKNVGGFRGAIGITESGG